MTHLIVLATLGLAPIPAPGPVITEALPIRLYSYDPSQGGINCYKDCTKLGNGMEVTERLYDRSAACPIAWAGYTITIPSIGLTLPCNDAGGAIRIAWEKEYGLVIRVDVLSRHLYDPGPYYDWVLEKYDGPQFRCVRMVSWGIYKARDRAVTC